MIKKFLFVLFLIIASRDLLYSESYNLDLNFHPQEKTISGSIKITFKADKDSNEIYIAL